MAERRDATRTVLESIENDDGSRCVDLFVRVDGSWGFEEFRRDPEDGGRWSMIGGYGGRTYPTRDDAFTAAGGRIRWFADVTASRRSAG